VKIVQDKWGENLTRIGARWIIICIILLISLNCYGLGNPYSESFRKNLWLIIDRHPGYFWGGAEDEKKGVDCSGYIYLAAKRSGVPVKRVTAIQMRTGLGGWLGKDTDLGNAGELDLVWWTWIDKPHRPNGHVGVFLIGRRSELMEVTHSSSSHGVIIQELKGQLFRDISAIRRLDVGDRH
jgi:hypothetical protein